mgnify:CR=1 FL=1
MYFFNWFIIFKIINVRLDIWIKQIERRKEDRENIKV